MLGEMNIKLQRKIKDSKFKYFYFNLSFSLKNHYKRYFRDNMFYNLGNDHTHIMNLTCFLKNCHSFLTHFVFNNLYCYYQGGRPKVRNRPFYLIAYKKTDE